MSVFLKKCCFFWLLLAIFACKNDNPKPEEALPEASEPATVFGYDDPGVQLWCVRDSIAANPKSTLKALADMGYKRVEGFGYNEGKFFGLTVDEFKAELDKNGLQMPSLHFGLGPSDFQDGKLSEKALQAPSIAKKLGASYLVCPYLLEEDRGKTEEIVALLTAMGKHCKEQGIRFAYHNHDFEFTTKAKDGRMLMEHIIERVPNDLMALEMDLYWVTFAGQDPLVWFEKYPNRFELWHVKDMAQTEARESTDIGTGSMNFPAIFAQAEQAGLQIPVIEVEHYTTTQLNAVENCLKAYKKMEF